MKLYKSIFIAVLFLPLMVFAQEEKDTIVASKTKLERAAFESTALIESQTNVVNTKGTVEMVMNHRFSSVKGENDMIGIWGPANIRIALSYAVTDRIQIGFGTTKDNRMQDGNLKVAVFRQTRSNKMPLSVTYFGNVAYDARPSENFIHSSDRYSFFNQIILARRFTKSISLQIAPSVSHYNMVASTMRNDMVAISYGGRFKISPQTSIMAEYHQPITTFEKNTPKAGANLGLEFSTGSHAFQIFITNYKGIVPQKDFMFNQNNFFNGEFMIGFNITRLWHL